jgi:hypothetical protein
MDVKKLIFGLILAAAFSSNALAEDPMAGCRTVLTEDRYNAAHEVLTIIKKADVAHLPADFVKSCEGAATFHLVVRAGGSVGFAGVDANGFRMRGKRPGSVRDSFADDTTGGCDDVLIRRIQNMRFAPPQPHGKSLCVLLDVGWASKWPHDLLLKDRHL